LLILDEATSSVDTRTEVLVQRAMAALRSIGQAFVIAHRLSTIRDADVILVMEDGQIVEQGTHHELLDARGHYFDLYNSQFRAAIEEQDEQLGRSRWVREHAAAQGGSETTSDLVMLSASRSPSRTIARTSSGRSSIMVQVKRSTYQPSSTRRFCRHRSVSKTSAPV
jgi:ABC-type multidrug transport system ATPase subunit